MNQLALLELYRRHYRKYLEDPAGQPMPDAKLFGLEGNSLYMANAIRMQEAHKLKIRNAIALARYAKPVDKDNSGGTLPTP